MPNRDDKQKRAGLPRGGTDQVPASDSQPGYPPLRQHLLTRRDALTFVGAALVTGVTPGCLTGDGPTPSYETFRMPYSGDVGVSLTGGGALRCYFNIVAYYDGFYAEDALSTLEVELRTRTYAQLASIYYDGDIHALRALERELEASLFSSQTPYGRDIVQGSLAMTIVTLIQ